MFPDPNASAIDAARAMKSELHSLVYRLLAARRDRRTRGGKERGAQLVEMALVLPLLLLLAVGILDFGTAYNLRQILNNSAREAARLGASQPALSGDLTTCETDPTSPQCTSIPAICNDVVTYLWQAHVDLTFLGFPSAFPSSPPACPAPAPVAATAVGSCPTPTSTAFTWTYPSGTAPCGTGLTIEREVAVPNSSSGIIPSTRITLNYPYNWLYGFNNVIGFFGVKYSGTIPITTNAMMANLSP